MAAKKKAAKAGAGAFAAGQAVRTNQYVQRLVDDAELRENLNNAFTSAKKAYARVNGKGPAKALDDKKTQRELRDVASSLKEASDSLLGKKKKSRKGRILLLGIVGAGVALAASEGLRKKVLDALFGAEEEFEYTASTTPPPPASSSSSTSESEPVGTS